MRIRIAGPPDRIVEPEEESTNDSDVIRNRHTIQQELLFELLDHDTTKHSISLRASF
jgi:hypothetical protein